MTEYHRRQPDGGMTFVKQATTWLAVGGVAATGLFAGVAVASNSGHTTVAKKATSSGTSTSGSAPASSSGPTSSASTTTPARSQSDGSQQFQAPTTAPANVSGGGAVVSGGS